jgi:hypothetical protein
MLKRNITYKDFNGETVTDIFYFNLGKAEIVEMEVSGEGGSFGDFLRNIVKTEDRKGLVVEFKKLILMSYGEKSQDGKHFEKDEIIRKRFSQTAAFDALFMELISSDDAAAIFVQGILPSDMSAELDKAMKDTDQSPEAIIKRAQEAVAAGTQTPSLPASGS